MKKFFAIFLIVLMLSLVVCVMAETVEVIPEIVDAIPVTVVDTTPKPLVDLTGIATALLSLLGALITYKIIPWLEANKTEKQQKNLTAIVSVLVFAAEQLYGATRGDEKMEYVEDELQARGYKIDLAEIEAAVQKLTLLQDALPPVVPPAEPFLPSPTGNQTDV